MEAGKIICFDFGNTNLKYCLFDNEVITQSEIISGNLIESLNIILSETKPDLAILSSVIKHKAAVESCISDYCRLHVLGNKSKLPFKTPVSKPETIGADRLAICAAIAKEAAGHHSLAIGLGTCITYNFINIFNEFLGGSISPGLHLRLKAMNDHTAFLPHVTPEYNVTVCGYDTNSNLQSGVILGISKEIDGIINLYKENYLDLKVFITGGDMQFVASYLESDVEKDSYLLFKGLRQLCLLNLR